MSIYTDEYLNDKTKISFYQAELNKVLGFEKDGKESKWVKFLESKNILIAPGENTVGNTFQEYKGVSVSTIPTDKRTYDDVPGTFFAKGTTLNGKVTNAHIVYLNMKYDDNSLTSMNFFAHELGHAIDHVLAKSMPYYSLEPEFTTTFDKAKDFFRNTKLAPSIIAYLDVKNEFFAECFAFYRTKHIKLEAAECFNSFFDATLAPADKTDTPHEYLKKHAKDMSDLFKSLAYHKFSNSNG